MRLHKAWVFMLLACLAFHASVSDAHKPSDSYLTLHQPDAGVALDGQWDIALRDLEHAIGVDANGDGAITWGEVKRRGPAIEGFALRHLQIDAEAGASHGTCVPRVTEMLADTHVDGAYAVLRFVATCPFRPARLTVRYSLLFDLDPNHRGLLDVTAGAMSQASVLGKDAPSTTVSLESAGRMQQLRSFVSEGIWHIWEGYDHILFLLTLLFPAVVLYRGRRWEPRASLRDSLVDVAKVVTAFTVAHSLTLSLSVNGLIHLPSRLVETGIAITVLLGALNNLYPVIHERRWVVAFVFGLIHGLGFASVLTDLGLQGLNLALALVGFNLGVEIGQLAIVLVFVPVGYALRGSFFYRRVFMPTSAALIGCIALYWMTARALGLSFL